MIVLEVNLQFLHCKISWGTNVIFWICVYGSYDPGIKKELWKELGKIGSALNSPWLIQGDFNSICSNEDKIGRIPINEEAARDFQNWILSLDLVEVKCNGQNFTWTNYQEGERRIYRKIEWCFAN